MYEFKVNVILQSTACSWINIFVYPGATFQNNKFTVYVKFRLRWLYCTSVLFPCYFRYSLWL